jgi:glutamate 5-kinase
VQGLFDRPPHEEGAKLVPRVPRIDNKILALAGPAKNGHAGGMRNKLEAARQLTESGIHVVIAYGREDHVLERILAGEDIGTWFDAVATNKDDASWLAQASPAGSIQLDAGAAAAVRAGNNLLLAGVVGVEGDFPVDSVVDLTHAGKAVARAVCRYASADLLRCRGLQTEAARAVLGFEGGMNVAQKEATLLL